MTRLVWLCALIGAVVGAGASHAGSTSEVPPTLTADERLTGFVRLWEAAKTNFVFAEQRPGLDWDALLTEYLPQVRAEQPDRGYYRVLTRFAASLHDAHTLVAGPGFELAVPVAPTHAPPLVLAQVEGKAVVIDLVETDEVRRAGITRGVEITHIAGRPVREVVEKELSPYISASTPQARDAWVYPVLLDGAAGSRVSLGLRELNGAVRTITLTRETMTPALAALLPKPALAPLIEEQRGPQGGPYPWQSRPKREARDLGGGLLYVPIDTFFFELAVTQYDALADRLARAKGLLLDLRENGGGNSDSSDAIVSRLIDKPVPGSRWQTRRHLGVWAARGKQDDLFDGGTATIQPVKDRKPFLGPVVVLVGPRTLSAAEDFLIPLHVSHRATLVGQRTAGSTGQPMLVPLPGGGAAAICTKWDSYPDGREFVGVGVIPDVEVYPTQAEVAAGLWSGGKDPVLDRGVAVLREKLEGR